MAKSGSPLFFIAEKEQETEFNHKRNLYPVPDKSDFRLILWQISEGKKPGNTMESKASAIRRKEEHNRLLHKENVNFSHFFAVKTLISGRFWDIIQVSLGKRSPARAFQTEEIGLDESREMSSAEETRSLEQNTQASKSDEKNFRRENRGGKNFSYRRRNL
jgi:hypothetical protein